MITNKNWDLHEKILTTEKSDWQKRVQTLTLLTNALSHSDITAYDFTSKNPKGLALQLNDLRSAIVKLASNLIQLFSKTVITHQNTIHYEKFSDQILREESLHKALGSANKVINKHASNAVCSIFENNLVNLGSLEHFTKSCKKHKISSIRERCAQFIYIFMENVIEGGNLRKIRLGDLGFFRKSTDLFIRDANELVRNWAKKTRGILDEFKDVVSGFGEDVKERSFERRTTKEKKKKKKEHRKKEEKKYVPPKNYNKNIKSLNLTKKDKDHGKKAKTEHLKGFKKHHKKTPDNIFEILNDPNLSVLEQINFLRRFDLNKFCKHCDFQQFSNLLSIYQFIRNNELNGILDEIFINIKIDNFFSELLSFLDKEGNSYKKIPEGIWENLKKIDFVYFLDFFVKENSFGGLELVINKFDLDEFEYIVSNDENLAIEILKIIDQNLSKKNSYNKNQKFEIMNVKVLELIFQSTFMVKNFRKFTFSPNFLKNLNTFNSTLAKFFNYRPEEKKRHSKHNNTHKNGMEIEKEETPKKSKSKSKKRKKSYKKKTSPQKKSVSPKPKKTFQTSPKPPSKPSKQTKTEKSPNFTENKKIVQLLTQANLTTKKSVLKSIIDHLHEMQTPSGEIKKNAESTTVFNKTIDILKCTAEGEQIDQEIINTSFTLIELMNLFCISNNDLYKLLLKSVIYFLRNDLISRDFFCEKIMGSNLRQKILNFLISDLIILDDAKEIVFVIKILIVFLKIGKSLEIEAFRDEVLQILESVVSIMKKLFVHSQVSIRKNVVHFFVQSFYFFSESEFEEIMASFSPEQRKLIEIYIKKSQR